MDRGQQSHLIVSVSHDNSINRDNREYLLSSEISFWYSVAPSVAATAPSCNDAFLQPEVERRGVHA